MQAQIEILEVLVLTFPYSIVNVLPAAPVSLSFRRRTSPGARPVQPAARVDVHLTSPGAVECTTRWLLFDC